MSSWLCRAIGVIVCMLFIAALFSTYDTTTLGIIEANRSGRFLALWGWMGPMVGSIAWYANPLLAWIVYQLFRGRAPNWKFSLIAFGISLTALLPEFILDFERYGNFYRSTISGTAIWLWISAFAIATIAAVAARLQQWDGDGKRSK